MFGDGTLFGADDTAPDAKSAPEQTGVADWQVAQVRRALDARGVHEMTDRQRLIVELVGRPIDSLRDLESSEVVPLLQRLAQSTAAPEASGGSSWDDREEDTWIDRL